MKQYEYATLAETSRWNYTFTKHYNTTFEVRNYECDLLQVLNKLGIQGYSLCGVNSKDEYILMRELRKRYSIPEDNLKIFKGDK